MAIAGRRRPYGLDEVEHLLRHSETRAGHAFERHVGIANERAAAVAGQGSLEERGEEAFRRTPNGGVVQPRTAFSSNRDEFTAMAGILNSPIGQDALEHMDTLAASARVVIETTFPETIHIRYAVGEIIRTANLNMACAVLEPIADGCCHGIHVVTTYPVLWLRPGVPGWREGDGPWHR